MPSKTSKKPPTPPTRSKAARGCVEREEFACDETQVARAAGELARMLKPGDRVLLEGPMGAGKTFFARALLGSLGVRQPPEGSPTFAIAHEYDSPRGGVAHVDFYRIRSEPELEEAGIPEYFWGRELIAIAEWASLFPKFYRRLLADGRNWRVTLSFGSDPDLRDLVVLRPL